MVINKRRKNSRQRAGTTHGWGAMKKHRGAGNRGGVGNAGSGKRGDAKKPSYWKKKQGRHGFVRQGLKINYTCINICDLDKYNKAELNLADLGFNKLLGKGKVTKSYKISVNYASQKAVAKIEAAKGSVQLKAKKPESAEMIQDDAEMIKDESNELTEEPETK